ncbi:MAG: DUF3810 domain-containing protein [Oscillospiraceae bacterium]|nr:DUF3810 domain-containing protein [Oscillospiraceae bacterium]
MNTKIKDFIKTPFFYFLLLLPFGFALLAAARFVPGFADWYYDAIYKNLGGIFGSITGILPFSLMEAGILSAVLLLCEWIIRLVLKAKEGKAAVLKYFSGVLKNIVSIACVIFFLFAAFSGTNYYREGFAEKTDLKIEKSSVNELYDLCAFLLEEAAESGQNLLHKESGETVFAPQNTLMAKRAKEEFEKFAADYDFMDMGFGKFGTPKPVFFSEVMAYLQISGVYSPYTFEANICTAGPDFLRGSTMMHEQSHLRGFMNEAEANFIAYLACAQSEDDYFRYSGTCLALLYSMNALYAADYELWYELRIQYPEYVDADMRAQNAYIDAHDTKVAEVSDAVNDTYLKLNDQQEGTRSYGKMVDLLLAYRRGL